MELSIEKGNIWKKHASGYCIVVTTNGTINRSGCCVMGRGIALQAKLKFPDLPRKIGLALPYIGNVPMWFKECRIYTLPVKHNWYEKADLELIETSCKLLQQLIEVDSNSNFPLPVYLTKPGCQNGKLNWEEVKPTLSKTLSPYLFTICDWS